MSIDKFLKELVAKEGSDLHLKAGEPPVFRLHGQLVRSSSPPLTSEDVKSFVYGIIGPEQQAKFEKDWELDTSYSVPQVSRFRVNIFRQGDSVGAVIRVIPFRVKSLEELNIPAIVKDICALQMGLVLVTGPTGSGKSTTLAAMIDCINSSRKCHIITIEDPIEFLHKDKIATVNQREVSLDTRSFASAMKHVMRQSPDVVLVGELRDLETISLAVTAAETGLLVLTTLHTTDAPQTVDRMIDVFPPEHQEQIRLQLSTALQAVISQTLVPKIGKKGRVAAFEIMICAGGIKSLIREGKTHLIYGAIQTGAKQGMQLLDNHLRELVNKNFIAYEEALGKASNPVEFARAMGKDFESGL